MDIASAALEITRDNIKRLTDCLEMSNKYHFISIETWAYNTLSSVLETWIDIQELDDNDDEPLPLEDVSRISRVCVTTTGGRLLSLPNYLKKLWERSVLLAGTLEEIALVLRALDDLDSAFKVPRGLAYYQVLTVWSESWRNSSLLDREQKIRLLAGYHNLNRTRSEAELRKQLAGFEHHAECGANNQECRASWEAVTHVLITDVELGHSMMPVQPESETFDYMTRLRVVSAAADLLVKGDISADSMRCQDMTKKCRKRALKHTKKLIQDTEENLMDRFVV